MRLTPPQAQITKNTVGRVLVTQLKKIDVDALCNKNNPAIFDTREEK
jgi:hypothetical protein